TKPENLAPGTGYQRAGLRNRKSPIQNRHLACHSSLPLIPWHLAPGTYSYLSATIGSTFVARQAGRKPASPAMQLINNVDGQWIVRSQPVEKACYQTARRQGS